MPQDPAAKARAATERLYKSLNRPVELGAITARALLDAAQAAARSRPTPQAPMVSAGFTVDNDRISGPRGGALAALVFGSEYGSIRFAQFHGRYPGGSWLFPTLTKPPASVTGAVDRALEDMTNG